LDSAYVAVIVEVCLVNSHSRSLRYYFDTEPGHLDTMDIDKDEKDAQSKSSKGKTKPKVAMQQSVNTFGAEKSKRQEYPKNDHVMITDALSDVRVK
jgi:hypothetical protein